MTKKYPIISLNGFLYAVEAVEKFLTVDNYLFLGKYICMLNFDDGRVRHLNDGKGIHIIYEDDIKEVQKIIASNNPSIKNLPSLPEIEEIMEDFLEEEAEGNAISHLFEDEEETHSAARKTGFKDGYKLGYKAASKEKKYSEEDVISFLKFLALDHGHKFNTQKDAWDSFKNLLNKTPIAFECEMINLSASGYKQEARPKVDKNNHLIGRWIYEEGR